MARTTPQQQREKALVGAIGRSLAEKGLHSDVDVAAYLGMLPQSYGNYRRKNFQTPGFLTFCKIARKLGLTGREVCAAVGVPYEDPKTV